ncbi:riboflavin kinase isoform X2 [Hyalella azteca]|uniref:Riboflavin kinase n=1 Tax=Hyalella azteca TaxID=294128 RepID=A0A8B7NSJ5_HYAAZ|nr:riboflavin kinase isoform X2 [Hyalella azteca]
MSSRTVFPHFAAGIVVKGFGRGSKELGIPTANFPDEVVANLPSSMGTGIYYGLAKVMDGPTYGMVMSVGWNPYYKNTKKSMETHILHVFDEDFYGSWLRVVVLGYIRPELNFESLDLLISAIKNDISTAERKLAQGCFDKYSDHPFLTCPVDTIVKNPAIIASHNVVVIATPTASTAIQKEASDITSAGDALDSSCEVEKTTTSDSSSVNGHLTNGHSS